MKLCLLLLVACSKPAPPPANPDFSPIATQDSPRGKLFADCLADAAAHTSYGVAKDGDANVLVFTCSGAPAKAFFEGLGAWAREHLSEAKADGKIVRSTNRVRKNLFGVDYCESDGAVYRCAITLNVGDFVR